MSLIKLAAYSLLGYVVYELYLGVSAGKAQSRHGANDSAAPAESGDGSDHTHGSRSVDVEDSDGAHVTRRVGRGVL